MDFLFLCLFPFCVGGIRKKFMYFQRLPMELQILIFEYLSAKDLYYWMLVSKKYYKAIKDYKILKKKLTKHKNHYCTYYKYGDQIVGKYVWCHEGYIHFTQVVGGKPCEYDYYKYDPQTKRMLDMDPLAWKMTVNPQAIITKYSARNIK